MIEDLINLFSMSGQNSRRRSGLGENKICGPQKSPGICGIMLKCVGGVWDLIS